MGMYGGESAKRSRGYSNNAYSAALDLGVFPRHLQKLKKLKTVKKYINKRGEVAYAGTSNLKQTQSMPQFGLEVDVQVPN